MRVQIQKWGNSLAIRIPKAFAKETKIKQGTVVDLSTVEGSLIARPLDEYEYDLDDLLAAITEDNLHAEVDSGAAVGREIW